MRAFQRATNVPSGLTVVLACLVHASVVGVEVLDDDRAAGELGVDGAAEAHLLAEQRVAAAGEPERRGRGRRAPAAPPDGSCASALGEMTANAAISTAMRVVSVLMAFSVAYEVS